MSESLASFRDLKGIGPATEARLVVLDAGKAIGGASRDIDLVVISTRAAGTDFGYRATLAARRLGAGGHTGTGHAARELALRFPAVRLPAGVHRLQLLLEVSMPEPARRPSALALAAGTSGHRVSRSRQAPGRSCAGSPDRAG